MRLAITIAKALFRQSVARGAETSTYVASSPALKDVTGGYFVDSKLAVPSEAAQDDAAARLLWQESVRLAGLDL